MERLHADSASTFDWVEELQPNTWIKALFSDLPRCDMLLNNHSKVFNNYTNKAKEMSMLSMLENLFYKMVHRIVGKQKEHEN
jgi:hypothetical protein